MSTALIRALAPVMHILTAPETEDLAIQEPEVGWWLHHGTWHRVDLPAMNYARLHGIAVMAAAQTRQEITPRSPLLDADLLGDLRLMVAMQPAVRPGTISLTFRRGEMAIDELSEVPKLFGTTRWNQWDKRVVRQQQRDGALLERFDANDLEGWLRGVAETRQTGLFAGGTGVGKTRLGKALTGAIPDDERIVTIEDAAEMVIRQQNHVRLFYAASGIGVTQAKLLKATLRMRPNRIMLAEMRDSEAANVFLSEIMAGHPGSYSTLHSRSAPEAARRLFSLLAEGGADRESTLEQLDNAIDFIIPVELDGGERELGEVWFRADAKRRGETFRDLMRVN
jgi:type IV secretion system protein VirB11